MKQLLQKLRKLAAPCGQDPGPSDQMDRFAQSVLDRYRTNIRRRLPQELVHIRRLPLWTEREPASIHHISNWNVHPVREKETLTKLVSKIRDMDVQGKQIRKKTAQDSARIEKLERRAKGAAGMEHHILRKIHSHMEREIRSVREENLFCTRKSFRNIQKLELESRKQVQVTLEEGFCRELRILRRIQEERPEVLLVYPDIRWYLRQGRIGAQDAGGSRRFLPQPARPKSGPAPCIRPYALQAAPERPAGQEIRELVKEQLQEQAGWLSDKLYRRLERQLFDEKKRRGF